MFRSPPVSVTLLSVPRFLYFCRRQWRTQEFCSGGGSTNSVEDRDRDLGAVAP